MSKQTGATASTAVAVDLGHSKVNLWLKCTDLPRGTGPTPIDPVCQVRLVETDGSGRVSERVLGATERVANNPNPVFRKCIPEVDYFFEMAQTLRIVVYDTDAPASGAAGGVRLEPGRQVGEVRVSLAEIVASGRDFCRFRLAKSGYVYVKAESTDTGTRYCATFSLSVCGLATHSGGSCSRKDVSAVVYQNDCVIGHSAKKTLHGDEAEWDMTVHFVCPQGSEPKDLQWTVGIDAESRTRQFWESTLRVDLGSTRTEVARGHLSVADLLSSQRDIRQFIVTKFALERVYSWLDYLQFGLKIHIIPVFDLTGSNGDPRDKGSLHRLVGKSAANNDYYRTFQAVGSILEPYAHEAAYPVWGFGYKTENVLGEPGIKCGSLIADGLRRHSVKGVEGVLGTYEAALKRVTLAGPTLFAPILHQAIARVRERRFSFTADDQNYTIVLILTDGVIDDMQATKNALVEAAREPMSVVIVGIGDADFGNMDVLDGDDVRVENDRGVACERDIVQFVPMRKFGQDKDWARKLAAEVLKEIPRQFMEFAQKHKAKPGLVQANPNKGAGILRSLSTVGKHKFASDDIEETKEEEPRYPSVEKESLAPPKYEYVAAAPSVVPTAPPAYSSVPGGPDEAMELTDV